MFSFLFMWVFFFLLQCFWTESLGIVTSLAAAKSLQSCPTLRPHRRQPTRLRRPWDSPGKNTSGLPFPSPMHESEKWKWSRSVVSDSSDPVDCSPPGPSVLGLPRREHWSGRPRLLRHLSYIVGKGKRRWKSNQVPLPPAFVLISVKNKF